MRARGKHVVQAFALACGLGLAGAACGPVGYVSGVTRGASVAVEEARALNAAKYAPYWWTRAVAYLDQAREEAARADWQAANRFGRLASEAADKAKADAIRRAADPRLMEEITPPPPPPGRGGDGLAPAIDGDGPDAPDAKDVP